jgi:predicted transposase YbfD/YdcC
MARQAARLLRQTTGRKDEEVALITSADLERLNASQWLKANRDGWGIESGLHQRLDISYNDDRCRVQSDKGIWIFGMFRRLANSLFMEWRQAQRRPDHVTTTDFQALLAYDNRRRALRFVSTQKPSLRGFS